MKTQMRFQKITMLVMLIVSALTIVYGLIFATPIAALEDLTHASPSYQTRDPIGANYTYDLFQQYTVVTLVLGIIFLLLVAVCYITACNSRRNYYISNYVAIIATAAYAALMCVLLIAFTAVCHVSFVNDVNWSVYYNDYYNTPINQVTGAIKYSDDATVCFIGYVVGVICLASAGLMVYNLIWKIKLMKGEKALLAAGFSKEAA